MFLRRQMRTLYCFASLLNDTVTSLHTMIFFSEDLSQCDLTVLKFEQKCHGVSRSKEEVTVFCKLGILITDLLPVEFYKLQ